MSKNYLKINKEAMLEIYNDVKKKFDWFNNEYFKSRNIDKKQIKDKTYHFDLRDIPFYVMDIIGNKEMSKEEFFKACDKELEKLQKNTYDCLNDYYYKVENFDHKKTEYKTKDECFKLLIRSRLNQSDSLTLQQNRDYYKKRYLSDVNQIRKLDFTTSYNNVKYMNNIREISELLGKDVNTLTDNEYPKFDTLIDEELNEVSIDQSIIDYALNKTNYLAIEIPEFAFESQRVNNSKKIY